MTLRSLVIAALVVWQANAQTADQPPVAVQPQSLRK